MIKSLSRSVLLMLAFFSLSAPTLTFAQVLDDPCSKVNAEICQQNNEPGENASGLLGEDGVVGKLIQLLGIAAGIIAVIMIILAGLKFVASGGDSAKVAGARNAILYAAVGLVVAVMAQLIIIFVINKI